MQEIAKILSFLEADSSFGWDDIVTHYIIIICLHISSLRRNESSTMQLTSLPNGRS